MQNLCFEPECTISGTVVVKHPFYSIGPKMIFKIVSEHFANLRHVKHAKLVFRAWMHYFGVPRCKASILLHWTRNDVWDCFRTFRKPSVRKRCKTCVSGLNALFWGTEVVKHPFNSIGPKMMFVSVSEHFANLQHVKDAKLVFRAWMHYFEYRSCKASILLHWTQNDL
jgi:acid stress-induced BolA-like protein IbaG/YrbA